jgi:hypothetical protein
MLQQSQVLAWETTPSGFSFQFASDGRIIIEHDAYLQPQQKSLPGQTILPFSDLDALKRFIQKIEAIKNGGPVQAPALFIAS